MSRAYADVANKVTNGTDTEEAGRPRSGAAAPSPDGAACRNSAPAASDRVAPAPVDAARPGSRGGAPAPAPVDSDEASKLVAPQSGQYCTN